MKKHKIRQCRGRNSIQTSPNSKPSVAYTVAAWNPCGRCCTYQPIQVGNGPFW